MIGNASFSIEADKDIDHIQTIALNTYFFKRIWYKAIGHVETIALDASISIGFDKEIWIGLDYSSK